MWWHIVHLDVTVTTSSGLPPLIDQTSWDVRLPTEAKEELIGTAEAKIYDVAVASGSRPPAKADDPLKMGRDSIVSVGGIFATGKLSNTRSYPVDDWWHTY